MIDRCTAERRDIILKKNYYFYDTWSTQDRKGLNEMNARWGMNWRQVNGWLKAERRRSKRQDGTRDVRRPSREEQDQGQRQRGKKRYLKLTVCCVCRSHYIYLDDIHGRLHLTPKQFEIKHRHSKPHRQQVREQTNKQFGRTWRMTSAGIKKKEETLAKALAFSFFLFPTFIQAVQHDIPIDDSNVLSFRLRLSMLDLMHGKRMKERLLKNCAKTHGRENVESRGTAQGKRFNQTTQPLMQRKLSKAV